MASSTVTELSADRIFAIGDLHGCVDEPSALLKHLEQKEGLTEKDLVIFLGDYIDRGPSSKGVVDLVLDFRRRFPRTRFLKGNHEDMMMDFLGYGGSLGQAFLYNGGLETIQSYGISVFSSPHDMVGAIPPDHFKFYCELESIIVVDKFAFVHAGLNPLRDLYAQNDSDIYWIREEFLENIHSFHRTVIFGHTPHKEIFYHMPFKIGLDTGLVFGNKLSCLEIRSGKLFQVSKGGSEIAVQTVEMGSKL